MDFRLNKDLAAWMDSESTRIAGLVEDATDKISRGGGLPSHPDLQVTATISPNDVIGEMIASKLDMNGNIVARFYQHQGRILGLANGAMADAQKAVERIWSRPELCDLVSRTTILELLLQDIGAKARGSSTESLSTKVVRFVTEAVQRHSVWVPIDEVFIEGELSFATAVLAPVTREQIDEALHVGRSNVSTEQAGPMRDGLYSKWAGRTVMRFELVAEPQRAEEIATERAVDYMSLLQFYTLPAMLLSLVSHAAPRGSRPYRTQERVVFAPGVFQQTKRVAEATYNFVINAEMRALMKKSGLNMLSKLAQSTSCDYEGNLLDSLLVYGRAFYQLDPNDKLLQVMTAIEMFALRNDSEPIQAALADRMAFAISQDPNTRQEIVQNFRAAYSIRSGRSHHGRSIADTETIEQFLRNAWAFFLTAIQGVGRYRKRLEFLDHLDRTRYGHG